MATHKVSKASRLRGAPVIPGDKSISHRSLIMGALAEGITEIEDILESGDVRSTASCLQALGVKISKAGNRTSIHGLGSRGFRAPAGVLDCGNSGTSLRVLMGVLAGGSITAQLTGDHSLVRRPMKRVAEPLRLMGARFALTRDDYAPLTVTGTPLHGIDYELKIASAQIKTAILMGGLNAEGITRITGQIHSRDHTERMFGHFGVKVVCEPESVTIQGGQKLHSTRLRVPGDPSTAAFWMGAACLVSDSLIEMEHVSLNPTRIGFIRALERMGADIRTEFTTQSPEPIGRVMANTSRLKGVRVEEAEVPSLIDELPLLAVLATQANGVTEVTGAEELRVKETDRIEAIATNLRAMGCEIEVRKDGFRIEGPQRLRGAEVQSFHDHRIAMAFSIAGLVASGDTIIHDPECVSISYPEFFNTLEELTR